MSKKIKQVVVLLVAALFGIAGLAACNEKVDAQQSDETEIAEVSQNGEEEVAVEIEAEEATDGDADASSENGFIYVPMDQAEIDRLDAEGAPIETVPAEGVAAIEVYILEDSLDVVLLLPYDEADENNRKSIFWEYYNEDTNQLFVPIDYMLEYMTENQKSALQCIQKEYEGVFTRASFTTVDEDFLPGVSIVMDKVYRWNVVAPNCQVETLNRRHSVENILVYDDRIDYGEE